VLSSTRPVCAHVRRWPRREGHRGLASCLAPVRCQSLLLSGWLASRDAARTDSRDFHSPGNHTFRHRFADLWDLERFRLDLARCDEAICHALGETRHPLRWFRPPFGVVTAAVGEIAKTRRILPVTHFMIDLWVKFDRTRRPAKWIIEDAKCRQGGIYVLHDGMMVSGISRFVRGTPHRSWIPHVVHEVLGKLTAAGFKFPDPSQAFQACL